MDLTCARPSDCGIRSSDSLHDAVLKHTDIATCATHSIMFPFVQPVIDLFKQAPCNITIMAPAAQTLTKMMRYKVDKYCKQGKWAQTHACITANAIVELDEATVKNSKQIAQQGKQSQETQHSSAQLTSAEGEQSSQRAADRGRHPRSFPLSSSSRFLFSALLSSLLCSPFSQPFNFCRCRF